MREIPSLHTLCLRAVGSQKCSAEDTFAQVHGQPSTASRLLRSFHRRPVIDSDQPAVLASDNAIDSIPLSRTPCIGPGSARRFQANEVDMHHPLIACRLSPDDDTLVMRFGSPASDILQSYIDSLVELGRMDDQRLGLHFFAEWRAILRAGASHKRKRSADAPPPPLGSLSLYNCTLSGDTWDRLLESGLAAHLAIVDVTGVRGLTDADVQRLVPACRHLQALSLKNCRRVTTKCLPALATAKQLTTLDVGGSFNLPTEDILSLIPQLPHLTELHASGLGWTDASLEALTELRAWRALSLSFSLTLSHTGLRQALSTCADSLQSLALAFCESVIDNAALGLLGRNLPHVTSLDVRGNPLLTTLTGWYDGRVSADLPVQALVVLGRYSGLTEMSVEETKRVHPLEAAELVVILDGGGMGVGITRLNADDVAWTATAKG